MAEKSSKLKREKIQTEVDIWMIRDNLSVSYETRVARHQDTLDCIDALKKTRTNSAKSAKTSSISRPKPA